MMNMLRSLGFILFASSAFAQLTRQPATTLALPSAPYTVSGYTTENAFGSLSFSAPIHTAVPPGETNRVFVVERGGNIQVVTNISGTPVKAAFLNLASVTGVAGITQTGECGLLSMAFHPNYASNREFFIFYSFNSGGKLHQRVARLRTMPSNSNRADHTFIEPLITQLDESSNHNGGTIAFGPEGYLYIGVGDEGGGGDIHNNARFINKDFFGAMLRIDVDKKPGNLDPNPHAQSSTTFPSAVHAGTYKVPVDNPFIGTTSWHNLTISAASVRTEIWASGLRNPFRWSFDAPSGRLFCADVGQGSYEEVDILTKGGDFGWSWREGLHAFSSGPAPTSPPGSGFNPISPIFEYPHTVASIYGNSITGGAVYHGTSLPTLSNQYVYADYGSGQIVALRQNGSTWTPTKLTDQGGIVGFGTDPRDGGLLLCDMNEGEVKRLAPLNLSTLAPATLSATGVFSDVATLSPSPGVVPYVVNAPQWNDYGHAQHWFALKSNTAKIGYSDNGSWTFPNGMVWVQHFDLDTTRGNLSTRRKWETRVLMRTATGTYGLSYKWRDDQTDADLVDPAGMTDVVPASSPAQSWRFPSQNECMQCHTAIGGHALGFRTAQLNRTSPVPAQGNQLKALASAGYLDVSMVRSPGMLPALAAIDDAQESLEWRSLSYLNANCVQCHQPGAEGTPSWHANDVTGMNATGLIDGIPFNDGGDTANRLLKANDPAHSVLLNRLGATGGFSPMPPVALQEPDPKAINAITNYVNTSFGNSIQITTHPQSTAASEGSNASMTVVASGSGALSYQWQKDRVDIPGASSATLSLVNVQAADFAGYRVIITDANGAQGSNAALLEVIGDPPRIVTPPTSLLALVGSTAMFHVEALGRPSVLTYQWRRGTSKISAANNDTLTLANVQLTQADSYNVVIGGKVTSQSAGLTVVGQPTGNLNIVSNGTAALTIPYRGTKPGFLWKKNGITLSDDSHFSGTHSATLTIKHFTVSDEDDYLCEVTLGANTTPTNAVHLHLLQAATSTTSAPDPSIVSGLVNWQLTASEPATTFIVGGLPSGVTYDAKTNRIGGSPNLAGTFNVSITPTNAAGKGSKQTFNWTVAPFPLGVAGSYAGLVDHEPTVNADLGGQLSLNVSTIGAITGRLYSGATSHPLTGRLVTSLTTDPTYTLTIKRSGLGDLTLNFTIARSDFILLGSVAQGGASTLLKGRHALVLAPGVSASPVILNAQLIIAPGDRGISTKPQGTGWMRVTQSITGGITSATASGKLSDGMPLTLAVGVCDNLELLLRTVLYSGHGSAQGKASIAMAAPSAWPPIYALSGGLDWRKLALGSSSDHSYPTIAQGLTIAGRSHSQPLPGFTLLGNADTSGNAKLAFTEAGIASAAQAANVNQTFQLTARHKALFGSAIVNPCGVLLSLDPAKGTFSGSFKLSDGTSTRSVSYEGILVNHVGLGFFTLPQLPLSKMSDVWSGDVELKGAP